MVECNLAKVEAEGSNPFFRFIYIYMFGTIINMIKTFFGLDKPLLGLRFGLSLLFGLIPFRLFGVL